MFGRRYNEKELGPFLRHPSQTLANKEQWLVAQRKKGWVRYQVPGWLLRTYVHGLSTHLVQHFINTTLTFLKMQKRIHLLFYHQPVRTVSRSCGLSLAKSWIGPVLETKAQCQVPTFSLQRGMGVHRIEVGSGAL